MGQDSCQEEYREGATSTAGVDRASVIRQERNEMMKPNEEVSWLYILRMKDITERFRGPAIGRSIRNPRSWGMMDQRQAQRNEMLPGLKVHKDFMENENQPNKKICRLVLYINSL